MKRILLSVATIVFIGSLTAGATGAFFTDAQTSAGNIFTAGSVHLLIDHSLSTYNGTSTVDSLTIVSDPQTTFTGDDGSGNAVAVTPTSITNQYWTAVIPGATWIWSTPAITNGEVQNVETFTRTFTWNGPVTSVTLDIAADNQYSVSLNGNNIDAGAGTTGDTHETSATQGHYVIPASDIVQGTNTLTIVGTNLALNDPNPADNPAGILYKLVIQGQELFTQPMDLTGAPFWDFNDVKPMDEGLDVFSLHEATNDAWACVVVDNITNGTASSTTGGELGQFLHLFMWRDTNGDGIFEPGSGETELTPPTGIPFTGSSFIIPVNDSTTGGGPLLGNTSEDIGSAWCMGNMFVNSTTTGAIDCNDAGSVENESQNDYTTADLTFYATQARNQSNFECSDLTLPLE